MDFWEFMVEIWDKPMIKVEPKPAKVELHQHNYYFMQENGEWKLVRKEIRDAEGTLQRAE